MGYNPPIQMLIINNNDCVFKILGLDPGTDTFGFSIIEISLNTRMIITTHAWTIKFSKLSQYDTYNSEMFGDRFARLEQMKQYLFQLLISVNPNIIVTESNFINHRFPLAGMALNEVLSVIRNTLFQYSNNLLLDTISPSEVKNAIGAKGNADKDTMRNLLLSIPHLYFNGNIQLLDEHSIDAVAVAYSKFIKIFK